MSGRTKSTIVVSIFFVLAALFRIGSVTPKETPEQKQEIQEQKELIEQLSKVMEAQAERFAQLQAEADALTYPHEAQYTDEEKLRLYTIKAMISYEIKEKNESGAKERFERLLQYRDELEAKYGE